MSPIARTACIVLVALIGLGAATVPAHAGQAGAVTTDAEDSPAPDLQHVILYGETAEDFLRIYAQALQQGFFWLDAPRLVYVPELDADLWMMRGYLDPEAGVYETHDLSSGPIVMDGETYHVQVYRLDALTAEQMITNLQKAFQLGLEALTLPRFGLLNDGSGRLGWTMDAFLLTLPEDAPASS